MTRRILMTGIMMLVLCSSVLAQAVPEGTEIAPDNIAPLEYARPLIEYASAILFLLLAMGIGFYPSKRVKDA